MVNKRSPVVTLRFNVISYIPDAREVQLIMSFLTTTISVLFREIHKMVFINQILKQILKQFWNPLRRYVTHSRLHYECSVMEDLCNIENDGSNGSASAVTRETDIAGASLMR